MRASLGHDDAMEAPAAGRPTSLARAGPMLWLASAVMLGIVLARLLPWLWPWLGLALTCGMIALYFAMRRRERPARHWAVLALVPLLAAWTVTRSDYTTANDLARYVTDSPQLAHFTGTIADEPHPTPPAKGAFARFSYRKPGIVFALDARTLTVGDVPRPVSGKLLVHIDELTTHLHQGQRVQLAGWLSPIGLPMNLGERNVRAMLAHRGVVGRLSLDSDDNCTLLAEGSFNPFAAWSNMRWAIARSARQSLNLGLQSETMTATDPSADVAAQPAARRLALLDALLLGQRSSALTEIYGSFRQTGLVHLLSISGAHLVIFMGLVWLALRLVIGDPAIVARWSLLVLALYVLALPLNVPIIRSAIMAALFCAGFSTGRSPSGLPLLALAAVVVLIWRPMELFMPGFELSFGVVAALLLWGQPVAGWLWPQPVVKPVHPSFTWLAARRLVDYLAASTVAFVAALPLVAYHFQQINPLSILLSALALPVATALLALGYLKLLLGLMWPSVSLALSGPVAWLADAMLSLVDHGSHWPGAAVVLAHAPSEAWTWAVLAVTAALFAGCFAGRRLAMAACGSVLVVWLILLQRGTLATEVPYHDPIQAAALQRLARMEVISGGERAPVRLDMFSVGNGSCYLLRLGAGRKALRFASRLNGDASGDASGSSGGGRTIMFDCGAGGYLDVAAHSIIPALHVLGVTHIDTLMISHPDMDHYCGVLDLADALPIDRVLVTPQFVEDVQAKPDSAAAYLMKGLRQRGLNPQVIAQGWHEQVGAARLEVLWPPAKLRVRRTNNASLVLSVRAAGRRLLLNGDIAERAIVGLLNSNANLRADVTDLPHHGSFVRDSPRWLAAVNPGVVLQSCAMDRLRNDRWAAVLAKRIDRLPTARCGMVELLVDRRGAIHCWTMR